MGDFFEKGKQDKNTMATTDLTPSINDILPGDSDIDFGTFDPNAPEQGTFPPDLKAGETHEFTFKLADNDPFGTRSVQGKKYFEVRFRAGYETKGGFERNINYLTADTFQTDKMRDKHMNSSINELVRSLGLTPPVPATREAYEQLFRQADAQGTKFNAVVSWSVYDKNDGGEPVAYSTHPRGQKEQKWPRGKDGQFEAFITLPTKGTVTGRIGLASYKLPKKG